MPRLSIIIPSHHRVDRLSRCLESVCRFIPPHSEILVVDDGSPRGIVSECARTFGASIIRRERSGGFCAAVNAGIDTAHGEFIELLNDDTEVTAAWAEAALAAFDDPKIVAVAPLCLMHEESAIRGETIPRIDSAGDSYDPGGFARKRGHGQRFCPEYRQSRFVDAASGTAAFYRTCALQAVGGFPESFGAYFEDVDVSLRLRRTGGLIRFEPASIVWHHVSSSYGKSPSRRVLEQQSCNEERLFWRSHSATMRLKYFPRHLAVLAGKSAKRLAEGKLTPWLMGRLRALLAA